MRAFNKLITLTALSVLLAAPAFAEGKPEAAPEASKSAEHSNAPATGTQVKGTERAAEVGQGEQKGIENQAATEVKEKGKSEAKKAEKKEEVTATAPAEAAAPATAAPAPAPEKK